MFVDPETFIFKKMKLDMRRVKDAMELEIMETHEELLQEVDELRREKENLKVELEHLRNNNTELSHLKNVEARVRTFRKFQVDPNNEGPIEMDNLLDFIYNRLETTGQIDERMGKTDFEEEMIIIQQQHEILRERETQLKNLKSSFESEITKHEIEATILAKSKIEEAENVYQEKQLRFQENAIQRDKVFEHSRNSFMEEKSRILNDIEARNELLERDVAKNKLVGEDLKVQVATMLEFETEIRRKEHACLEMEIKLRTKEAELKNIEINSKTNEEATSTNLCISENIKLELEEKLEYYEKLVSDTQAKCLKLTEQRGRLETREIELKRRENGFEDKVVAWEIQHSNQKQHLEMKMRGVDNSMQKIDVRERELEGRENNCLTRERNIRSMQGLQARVEEDQRKLDTEKAAFVKTKAEIESQVAQHAKITKHVYETENQLKDLHRQVAIKKEELCRLTGQEDFHGYLEKKEKEISSREMHLEEQEKFVQHKWKLDSKRNEVTQTLLEEAISNHESETASVLIEKQKLIELQRGNSKAMAAANQREKEHRQMIDDLTQRTQNLRIAEQKFTDLVHRENRVKSLEKRNSALYEKLEVKEKSLVVAEKEYLYKKQQLKEHQEEFNQDMQDRQETLEKSFADLEKRKESIQQRNQKFEMSVQSRSQQQDQERDEIARERDLLLEKQHELKESLRVLEERGAVVHRSEKEIRDREANLQEEKSSFHMLQKEFQTRTISWDQEQAALQEEAVQTIDSLARQQDLVETSKERLRLLLTEHQSLVEELHSKKVTFEDQEKFFIFKDEETSKMKVRGNELIEQEKILRALEMEIFKREDHASTMELKLSRKQEELEDENRKIVAGDQQLKTQSAALETQMNQTKLRELTVETLKASIESKEAAIEERTASQNKKELALVRREERIHAMHDKLLAEKTRLDSREKSIKALEDELLQTEIKSRLKQELQNESKQKDSNQARDLQDSVKRELQQAATTIKVRANELDAEQQQMDILRTKLENEAEQLQLGSRANVNREIELKEIEADLKQEKRNQEICFKEQEIELQMNLKHMKLELEHEKSGVRKLEESLKLRQFELDALKQSLEESKKSQSSEMESEKEQMKLALKRELAALEDQKNSFHAKKSELESKLRQLSEKETTLELRERKFKATEDRMIKEQRTFGELKLVQAKENKESRSASATLARRLEEYSNRLEMKMENRVVSPNESMKDLVTELKDLRRIQDEQLKKELVKVEHAQISLESRLMEQSKVLAARQMEEIQRLHQLGQQQPVPERIRMEEEMDRERKEILERQKQERQALDQERKEMQERMKNEWEVIQAERQKALSKDQSVIEEINSSNNEIATRTDYSMDETVRTQIDELQKDRQRLTQELTLRNAALESESTKFQAEQKKMESEMTERLERISRNFEIEQHELRIKWDLMQQQNELAQQELKKQQVSQLESQQQNEMVKQELKKQKESQQQKTIVEHIRNEERKMNIVENELRARAPTSELQMMTPLLVARARTAREELAKAIVAKEEWDRRLENTTNESELVPPSSDLIEKQSEESITVENEENVVEESVDELVEVMLPAQDACNIIDSLVNRLSAVSKSTEISMTRLQRLSKVLVPFQAERLTEALGNDIMELLKSTADIRTKIMGLEPPFSVSFPEKPLVDSVVHMELWHERVEEKFHDLTIQANNLMQMEHQRKMLREDHQMSVVKHGTSEVTGLHSYNEDPSSYQYNMKQCLKNLEQSLKARNELLEDNHSSSSESSDYDGGLFEVKEYYNNRHFTNDRFEMEENNADGIDVDYATHYDNDEKDLVPIMRSPDGDVTVDAMQTQEEFEESEDMKMKKRDLNLRLQQISLDVALFDDEEGDEEELARLKEELNMIRSQLADLSEKDDGVL